MAAPQKRPLAGQDDIEAISRGLIREFLQRKGYKQALAVFDDEAVRISALLSREWYGYLWVMQLVCPAASSSLRGINSRLGPVPEAG